MIAQQAWQVASNQNDRFKTVFAVYCMFPSSGFVDLMQYEAKGVPQ